MIENIIDHFEKGNDNATEAHQKVAITKSNRVKLDTPEKHETRNDVILYKNKNKARNTGKQPNDAETEAFMSQVKAYIQKNCAYSQELLKFLKDKNISLFSSSMLQRFAYEYGYEENITLPPTIDTICKIGMGKIKLSYTAYLKKYKAVERSPNDVDDLV